MNIIAIIVGQLFIFWCGTIFQGYQTEAASQADFNLGFDYANQLCNDQP
jgi:hypothetical protein